MLFYLILTLFVSALTVWLWREMLIFPPNTEGVRVLMYHKFSASETDFLTVRADDFDRQLAHIVAEGYTFVSMQQVLAAYLDKKTLPSKPILITMDDAYVSQRDLAQPILEKYKACATIFVPTAHVGRDSSWDANADAILTATGLQKLPPSVFSLAPHTHTHENYKNLSLAQIQSDIDSCLTFLKENKLPFVPTYAYAFGARPKNAEILKGMKTHFSERKIELAFRIGNRINPLKVNYLYELCRIDVRGNEPFEVFVKKLKFGRAKRF